MVKIIKKFSLKHSHIIPIFFKLTLEKMRLFTIVDYYAIGGQKKT